MQVIKVHNRNPFKTMDKFIELPIPEADKELFYKTRTSGDVSFLRDDAENCHGLFNTDAQRRIVFYRKELG